MDNTSKEQIGLRGKHIRGFAVGNAESVFQRMDGTFDTGSATVYLSKSRIVTRYTRIQAQIFVERNINAAPVFGRRTRIFTLAAVSATSRGRFHDFGFWANEFKSRRTMLFIGMAAGFERGAVGRTKRRSVFVEAHIGSRHTSAGLSGTTAF